MLSSQYRRTELSLEMWIQLNQTTDSDYAAELSITKEACGQLKAGV
jgi:hypothetical protein